MTEKPKKLYSKALIYNARVLDVKFEDNEYLYFIHYTGWNKTWDEWVNHSRMFKDDEEGNKKKAEVERIVKSGKTFRVARKADLKKNPEPPLEVIEHLGLSQDRISSTESIKSEEHSHQEMHEDLGSVKESSLKPEEETVPSTKSVKSSKKRTNRPTSKGNGENEDGSLQRSQINVKLTEPLKAFLTDDWDLITRQSRIVCLPARKPVSTVIEEYLEYSKTNLPSTENATTYKITQEYRVEFVEGIKINFNCIMGSQLLYKFERPQYSQLMRNNEGKAMCDLYGPMHLLRFLVKLKDFVTFLKNDKIGSGLIEALAADLVEFLDKNRKEYFTFDDYMGVTPDYQREAMC